MQAGERFLLQSAGGGGCGDPRRRDRAALARDMAEGYVSADAAKKDYGGGGGGAAPPPPPPPHRKHRIQFFPVRAVVGMINPTLRPGVTEEVIRLLPEGIGLIPLFLNIRRGTEDEFATMMPAYEELVAVLAECGCDLIHPHGAPPFMVQGRKREAEI